MNYQSLTKQFYLFLVISFIFANLANVWATDFTSTNFISRDPIMSSFGSRASSTSFEAISAGGQTVTGESTSTSFILRSGFLYFEEKIFAPKSQNWRWFDDETNETPAAPLAAENVAPANIANQNIIKLRLTIKETANATSTNIKFKLQFSEFSDFSQGVNDAVEISNCATNSLWCYASGAGADNTLITIKVLSDADACAGSIGKGCGTHNTSGTSTSAFTPPANAATEYEFTIKQAGARANAVYFFRAFDATNNRAVPTNTGQTFPSLSIEGAALTLTVSGLPAATSTAGIITDAATTPTSVAFGSLAFDAETEAAQRLTVSTNATEGYQIFVLEGQGLLGPTQISPLTAPNDAPAAWAIPTGAAGAYGYHTTDATLAGASVRFAPNNTYAKFESTAQEIAFSSGPVAGEVTDIIFKSQITNQQEAGDYNSSVTYIAVPTF